MHDRIRLSLVFMLACVAALSIATAARAYTIPASPDPPPGTSSGNFSVAGIVVFPPDRWCPSESVAVTGIIHVIQVIPPDPIFPDSPIHVYLTVPRLHATGVISHDEYLVVGAGFIDLTVDPADAAMPVRGGFAVVPLSSCPRAPVTITGMLPLTASGIVDFAACTEVDVVRRCFTFSLTQSD